jgi:hypothetical protein
VDDQLLSSHTQLETIQWRSGKFSIFVFHALLFEAFIGIDVSLFTLKAFQLHNTPKQNENCLKNFDLTEYRGILSDIAIWLFQGIIKDFEKKLNPLIVAAMLEHEALPGISDTPKPTGLRSSSFNTPTNELRRYTIENLLKKLNEFLGILNSHGVDPEIVNQIFKQVCALQKYNVIFLDYFIKSFLILQSCFTSSVPRLLTT